ncbi:MAG: M14 family metallocarboxypeptidase [Verrucomicrobiales bacterium]|nr:M14 family metallocarboxypeptidase [Verrucomicrobiales bacterium]
MKPLPHSGHDIELLLARWDALADKAGWKREQLFAEQEMPIWVFETGDSESPHQTYISAGVHGDECAPIWALLGWAEAGGTEVDTNFVLIPCFNPVGIVENTRTNGKGVDLNRHFQNREIPLIEAWQDYLGDRRFDVALNLHEDYDAKGIYLYEVARENPVGEEILAACEGVIPRETAEMVDGSAFQNGLLSHDEDVSEVIENDLEGGWPEALYLYVHHVMNSYTFETPSEFDLERRIAAHRRCLETLFPAGSRD